MTEDMVYEFQPVDIWQARKRIMPYVLRTPLIFSKALSERLGSEIYLKMECWQRHGCFKVRGAVNFVASMTPAERQKGLVTASSGNHAIALSYASNLFGNPPTTVFLPESADKAKISKIESFGVKTNLIGKHFLETLDIAVDYAERTGATYVHSHAVPRIIAGQGTIGLEILEDLPDLDAVIVPVGGGGILAGISTAIKSAAPQARVIGAEPAASPGAFTSMRDGVAHERIDLKPSLADGLSGGTSPYPFKIFQNKVEQVILLEEDEIAEAMRVFQQDEQIIVEGAACVGLATLLSGKIKLPGLKVVLVLTSRNINAERYNRVVAG
jgi:threonine dehydratase